MGLVSMPAQNGDMDGGVPTCRPPPEACRPLPVIHKLAEDDVTYSLRHSASNLHVSPGKRRRTYTDPSHEKAEHPGYLWRYDSACSVAEVTPLNSCQNIFIAPTRDDSHVHEKNAANEKDGDTLISERGSTETDGGYGWVIVGAAFSCAFTLGFVLVGFSVLYVAIAEHFQSNKGPTGLIGSLFLCTGNFFGFLFSPMIQRYGCRALCITGALVTSVGFLLSSFATSVQFLYVTFGVIAGLGNGLLFLTFVVIVQMYFRERRALAHGIASCGLSFGGMVCGPVLRAWLDLCGLKGTFILLAGLYLQNAIVGALYRPLPVARDTAARKLADTPPERGGSVTSHPVDDTDGGDGVGRCQAASGFLREAFDVTLLKEPQSVLMYITTILIQFGTMMLYSQAYGRAVHIGIEPHLAALLVAVHGGSTLAGRLLCSVAGTRVRRHRMLLYAASIATMSLGLMAMPLTASFLSMTLVVILCCTAAGFVLSLQTPVLVDLFGVERIARSQAFQNMATGVGILCAVPFSGWLFDISQGYSLPHLVCGGIVLLSGGIMLVLNFVSRSRKSSCPEVATPEGCKS